MNKTTYMPSIRNEYSLGFTPKDLNREFDPDFPVAKATWKVKKDDAIGASFKNNTLAFTVRDRRVELVYIEDDNSLICDGKRLEKNDDGKALADKKKEIEETVISTIKKKYSKTEYADEIDVVFVESDDK